MLVVPNRGSSATRVDLKHLPGQQRDRSEFERLRPSALSARAHAIKMEARPIQFE
jgi:hypothetical protein